MKVIFEFESKRIEVTIEQLVQFFSLPYVRACFIEEIHRTIFGHASMPCLRDFYRTIACEKIVIVYLNIK
jgi:hypothetical protein